jgi:hypothetical protein
MNRPMHEPDGISLADQADLGTFLQHMVKVGASVPDPALSAVELAAAAGVANLILTLDETITKN